MGDDTEKLTKEQFMAGIKEMEAAFLKAPVGKEHMRVWFKYLSRAKPDDFRKAVQWYVVYGDTFPILGKLMAKAKVTKRKAV